MKDSESELPKVSIESIFPHHISMVRNELGKERAEEYLGRGDMLFNGLMYTFFCAVMLFTHSVAGLFPFMQDLETQIFVVLFTIWPIALLFKLFRFSADFYDVPAAGGLWKYVGLIILLQYFLSVGIYFYDVAENNGWFEEKASKEAAAESLVYEIAECIDVPAAGIKIQVPESCQGVAWKQRDRNISAFVMAFDNFQVSVEVRTVYTSETATLKEFEDEFCEVKGNKLGDRPAVKPGIHTVGGRRYLAATGPERSTYDNVLVRYMTLHKGARFDLNATIPVGVLVPESRKLIEDIVSSVTFYDPVQ